MSTVAPPRRPDAVARRPDGLAASKDPVATPARPRDATVRRPGRTSDAARPGRTSDATRRPRRRWLLRLLWAAGLVVAVVTARAALPELRAGADALRHAHTGLLAAAVVVEVAALVTLPLTFRAALATLGGSVSYGTALRGALGAFALSRVMPAGGIAGAVYAGRRFMRAGNSAAVAGGGVAVASIVTMLALGVVVVGAAAVEAVAGRGSIALVWSLAGLPVIVVGAAVALRRIVRDPVRLDAASARIARLLRRPAADQVRVHLEIVRVALDRPQGLAAVVGWATLNWVLQLLALWTVFSAFGVTMPVGVLVLGFGAANLATALPHTPGGIGVVEAGMTATYVALGIPVPMALVGVLCYRLLGQWLPVLAALPLVVQRGEPQPAGGTELRPSASDESCLGSPCVAVVQVPRQQRDTVEERHVVPRL